MANTTVLVIDDDDALRVMLRSLLRREGFEVDDVANGNEAIARLSTAFYDAVILDVMMKTEAATMCFTLSP